MESFQDGDIVQDINGDIYEILGSVHPPEKVFVIPKYIQISSEKPFENSEHDKAISLLDIEPVLIRNIKQTNVRFISVNSPENALIPPTESEILGKQAWILPKDEIVSHFDSKDWLQDLWEIIRKGTIGQKKNITRLEREALDLALLISDQANIMFNAIGLTGSLLWNAERENSDINLIIYGIQNVQRFIKFFQTITTESKPLRKRLKIEILPLAEHLQSKIGCNLDECFELFYRKPSLLNFHEIPVTIKFVPFPTDLAINSPIYLDSRFLNVYSDPITIHGRLIPDKGNNFVNSQFFPGFLSISDASINGLKISRILIYDYIFCGFLEEMEYFEARGILQQYKENNQTKYQLTIGSPGVLPGLTHDYIIRKLKEEKGI
ncbi:MAG: hypothetical protein ACTSVL_10230 [Promethearchaeota archaeon]